MTAVEIVAPTVARTSPPSPATGDGDGFGVALAEALDEPSTDRVADAGSGATITFGEMISVLAERGEAFAPPPAAEVSPPAALPADGDRPADVPSAAWAHPGVRAAAEYLGTPYVWGGTDPNVGFDCSGFVQRAFADIGVTLPRVSADQSRAGEAVTGGLAAARPGDLVYWGGSGGSPNHIGIYLGDGRMLHAPRRGEDVQVAAVRQSPPDAIRRVA